MTTIWERLDSTLTPLGLPFAADAWIPANGADIPASYLVYFLISTPPQQWADNTEKSELHHVQISWFSRNGFPGTSLANLLAAMKAAGFTKGPMRALPYDSNARLFGLALEFYFLEEE